MASNKTGLNYYSVDTDRYMDIRIRRLIKDHGCRGLAVYDYLLCEVYRVQGCFVAWDEVTAFNVAEYLGLKESNVFEIVRYCGDVGLFNKELLSRGVITSASIQRRYLEMCNRSKRKIAKIPEECRIIPEEWTQRKKEKDIISSNESIISSSSSPNARTREKGDNPEETETGGITTCAQEAQSRKSPDVAPEKGCAEKAPPPPLPDGTYEYIPVAAVADYLTGEDGWIESLCMNKHLDRAYVEQKIREYAADLQNSGEVAKDKRDCKRHFNNWLRKSQQYEQDKRIANYEPRTAANRPYGGDMSVDEFDRATRERVARRLATGRVQEVGGNDGSPADPF